MSGENKIEILEMGDMGHSPLLNSPVIKRDYASSLDVSDAEIVDKEPVKEATIKDTTADKEPVYTKTNEPANSEYGDIGGGDGGVQAEYDPNVVQSMSFDEESPSDEEDGGGVGGDGMPVPDSVSDGNAKSTAKFILDTYSTMYPKLLTSFSEFDETDIMVREAKGELPAGSLKMFQEINERNKEKLQVTPDQRNMIRKPLEEVLKIHNLDFPPSVALAVAVIVVSVTLFMANKQQANSNKMIMQNFINELNNK